MDAEAEAFALCDYFGKIVAEYKKMCRRTSMCPDNGYLKAEEERLYGRILEFKSKYRPFIKERKNSLGRFDVDKYLDFHRMSTRGPVFSVPGGGFHSGPVLHGRSGMHCEPWRQHPGGYQSHGAGEFCDERDVLGGHYKRQRTVPDTRVAPTLLTSTEEACRTITLPRWSAPGRERDAGGAMRDEHAARRRAAGSEPRQARPCEHGMEQVRENIDYLNRMVVREFYDRNDYRKPLAMFLRHKRLADLESSREPFEGFEVGAEHMQRPGLGRGDVDEMYRRCDMFLNEMMHLACSVASTREDRTLTPEDFALVLRTACEMEVPETLAVDAEAGGGTVYGGV
ncbi:UNVERIFIED_CONTAM: hypothetical protein PYX00_011273 [Menopon gallinae]|uniref:Uncharacterized protein n=1 Tax=Menopon gallinae TaxID=328185 RepID=A0AAW2H745_9NEOP